MNTQKMKHASGILEGERRGLFAPEEGMLSVSCITGGQAVWVHFELADPRFTSGEESRFFF